MLARSQVVMNGQEGRAPAGVRTYCGCIRTADATNGNVTWPVGYVLGGWIDRSGPGAGYADVTPTADQLLAALPDFTRGDNFSLLVTSSVAFANTIVAGTGIVLAGTTAVAASNTREYMVMLTSEPKRTRTVSGTTTNASAVLTNISTADLQQLGVGMAVTGTGIGASALVTAVNLSAGTVTVSVNSTATADNIGITFTPQFEFRGVRTAAN